MIPVTPILIVYVAIFLTGACFEVILTGINMRYLKAHGHTVPDTFKDAIDHGKLSKMTDYTVEKQKFHIFTLFISSAFSLLIILSGFLPWILSLVEGLHLGPLTSGMIFFSAVAFVLGLFSMPFNYYETFVIEQRHGFNTSSLKIWVADILKGVVVGCLVGGIMLLSILSLIKHGGSLWWLWAWFVFLAFQLLLLVIYPTVIAPWFNEFSSLEDDALEAKVRAIMYQSGLSVDGVFTMDAGKRSRHSNAYFTGLGKTKRIVLFDTLLTSHSHEEILAILAHEVGHWKRRHVFKNLLFVSLVSFAGFYVISRLLQWPGLYQTFGFNHGVSYVGLFLVGVVWDAADWFFKPLGSGVSRRFEREADAYAAELRKGTVDLISALKHLASDNLSNLSPHPVYAWFHYSHPPLLERIEYLQAMDDKGHTQPYPSRVLSRSL